MKDGDESQPPQPIIIQTGSAPEPTPRLGANTPIPATSMKRPSNLSPQTVEAYQSIMMRKPNNLRLTLLAVAFPLIGFIGLLLIMLTTDTDLLFTEVGDAFCGISLLLGFAISLFVWVRGGLWNNSSKEAGQRVLREAGVPDTPPEAWPGIVAAAFLLLFIIVGGDGLFGRGGGDLEILAVLGTVVFGSYGGWRQSLYRKELNRKVWHLLNVNNSAGQE